METEFLSNEWILTNPVEAGFLLVALIFVILFMAALWRL